ncbi:MAG: amidohydrolase family protein [Burkholderiales bacterium]|nr:amidohydrolase family protein [Burkholderiales bacterium]
MHDLLIRAATVHDGLGSEGRRADVAVREGRITAVGRDLGAAREVVDADGLVLMPGIVDTHTHYDAQITWDSMANPSPAMGVTTLIMGNCGFTIAPCRPDDRDLVMRNLTHVEGMSLDALRAGIRWDFQSFPEYLDMLEHRGVGPNVACFVGHSSVRTYVLGEDAPRRAATAEEVARMRAIVLDAMRAGAVGFSTTTSFQHNGENGIPMPSRLADKAEMEALCGSLREVGHGVLMMTKAGSTPVPWIEELSALAGRPFVVAALLHSNMAPEATFEDLDNIAAACRRGRRLYGAVACTPLVFEFTMHEPYVFEGLTSWQPAMALHGEQAAALYRDSAFRDGVKRELARRARRMFNGEWDKIFVRQAALPENAHYEGQPLSQLAAERGVHPMDFLLDLSLAEKLDTVFTATLLNSDEEAVGRMLCDEHGMLSLSDAGAHLTFLCDAGFGLHFLGHWVRDKGLMPFEQAVRRLTSHPADAFGIRDRGRIVEGAHADLLLLDPAKVGRGAARRIYDLPAGASRLHTPARGVHGVWVNGVQVADDEGILPEAPNAGQVLREFAA